MVLRTDMICCKPMRQQYGLACEPVWMACCLAAECAKLPTLDERRQFAGKVALIKCLADPQTQEIFRIQVGERFKARRAG